MSDASASRNQQEQQTVSPPHVPDSDSNLRNADEPLAPENYEMSYGDALRAPSVEMSSPAETQLSVADVPAGISSTPLSPTNQPTHTAPLPVLAKLRAQSTEIVNNTISHKPTNFSVSGTPPVSASLDTVEQTVEGTSQQETEESRVRSTEIVNNTVLQKPANLFVSGAPPVSASSDTLEPTIKDTPPQAMDLPLSEISAPVSVQQMFTHDDMSRYQFTNPM